MKIAIPYENGQVFQHFGHSAQFKLYTAEEGRITGAEVVSTDDSICTGSCSARASPWG